MKIMTFLGFLLFIIPFAQASNHDKEQRWKEQLTGDLFDGEPVVLNDGQHDFLGLIIPAESPKANAIVILHGVGAHPDWPQIINPLRVELAEAGWTTLSIQLPILENDATPEAYNEIIDEAPPRIAAALIYLQQQGARSSYIVAHSMGARMAGYFLAHADKNRDGLVTGFVGIGMNAGTVEYIDKYALPMLDIYGSEDLQGVLDSANERAARASHNATYTQLVVPGADHFFDGMEDELFNRVRAWLNINQPL